MVTTWDEHKWAARLDSEKTSHFVTGLQLLRVKHTFTGPAVPAFKKTILRGAPLRMKMPYIHSISQAQTVEDIKHF